MRCILHGPHFCVQDTADDIFSADSEFPNCPGVEADLVFLVDSSASVGATNFYNEIKFIRKLLADFTVSQNTTRSDNIFQKVNIFLHCWEGNVNNVTFVTSIMQSGCDHLQLRQPGDEASGSHDQV